VRKPLGTQEGGAFLRHSVELVAISDALPLRRPIPTVQGSHTSCVYEDSPVRECSVYLIGCCVHAEHNDAYYAK